MFEWWKGWRNRRFFDAVGPECRIEGYCLEVKGHVRLGARCVVRNNVVFRTHKRGRIDIGDGE